MTNNQQIITPQRLKEINMSLGSIISLKELLSKAEACGQDVSQYRAELDLLEAQLNQWKKQFAPLSA